MNIFKISIKTILILSLLILFINTNTVLKKEDKSSSFSDERTTKSCSQEKNFSSVSPKAIPIADIEITEVPSSDYTDAIFLWFQLMHPSDVDNPFNSTPLLWRT